MTSCWSGNRHGLVASAVSTIADGYAEREAAKAMISDARQAARACLVSLTLSADRGYDAKEAIEALQEMNTTPHVAQNISKRSLAVLGAIAQNGGLRHLAAKAKAHRAGLWLGQDCGTDSSGDGAWTGQGRPAVCVGHGGLKPVADAYLGTNPADAVRGKEQKSKPQTTQNELRRAEISRCENEKTKKRKNEKQPLQVIFQQLY